MNLKKAWTNQSLKFLERYKARAQQIEESAIRNELLKKESNKLSFYDITAKEDLPKSIQNAQFHTSHLKEKDISKAVKLQRDWKYSREEEKERKKLKEAGELMLLSEIYQSLSQDDPVMAIRKDSIAQLEEIEQLPCPGRDSADQNNDATDYRGWVERGLGIIEMSHASETNVLSRFSLIENSSKLLKKELEDKIHHIKLQIATMTADLYHARVQHHQLYEERTVLLKNDRNTHSEQECVKIVYKSTLNIRYCENKLENSNKLESNQEKIQAKKEQIEQLQKKIVRHEEQLRKVSDAETLYYKLTLKNGTDCRETGLTWIIRKLQNIENAEYPNYLDKRSRNFLVVKAANDEELQALLEQKKIFISEIGKVSTVPAPRRRSSLANALQLNTAYNTSNSDKIKEQEDLPKKYRKSIKQFSLLNEEYKKNSSLLQIDINKKAVQISANLGGMTNKQIYQSMREKIKKIDLQKLKKQRGGNKKKKLQQYQTLLDKIKSVHVKAEQLDMQQQNHLLSAYRDNKEHYFLHATACFGYKKAYSMIIKHFSWKACKPQ